MKIFVSAELKSFQSRSKRKISGPATAKRTPETGVLN